MNDLDRHVEINIERDCRGSLCFSSDAFEGRIRLASRLSKGGIRMYLLSYSPVQIFLRRKKFKGVQFLGVALEIKDGSGAFQIGEQV
jgi:hypothetical protein